jgi:hypothetical protein
MNGETFCKMCGSPTSGRFCCVACHEAWDYENQLMNQAAEKAAQPKTGGHNHEKPVR